MVAQKFVIADIDCTAVCGYGWNSPVEGWVMTVLPERATVFDTQLEALRAISTHYTQYQWKECLHAVPAPESIRHLPIGEGR